MSEQCGGAKSPARGDVPLGSLPDGYEFGVSGRSVPVRNADGERIGWSTEFDSVAVVRVTSTAPGRDRIPSLAMYGDPSTPGGAPLRNDAGEFDGETENTEAGDE